MSDTERWTIKCLMCGDQMGRDPGSRCRECGYVNGGTILLSIDEDKNAEQEEKRLRLELADLHRDYKTAAEERTRFREQLQKLEQAMLLAADKLETYGNDEPSEVAKFLRDYVEGVKVKA